MHDNTIPRSTVVDLQRTADLYNTTYKRFEMEVNTDKTTILFQPPSSHTLPDTNISSDRRPLENIDRFTYLESILSKMCPCEKDVDNRVRVAHSTFGPLNHGVFKFAH